MKQLTTADVKLIEGLAGEDGMLLKANGDYFTPASLGAYLHRQKLGVSRVSSGTLKVECECIDDVWRLIKTQCIRIQIYPYRLFITEKIKQYNDGGK